MKRRFPRFRFTLRGGGGAGGRGRVRLHVGYFSASVTVRASRVKETFSLALILGYHLTTRFKAFEKGVVGCKVLKFKRTGTSQNIGEKLFMGIK